MAPGGQYPACRIQPASLPTDQTASARIPSRQIPRLIIPRRPPAGLSAAACAVAFPDWAVRPSIVIPAHPTAGPYNRRPGPYNRHPGPYNRHSGASRNLTCGERRLGGLTCYRHSDAYNRHPGPYNRHSGASRNLICGERRFRWFDLLSSFRRKPESNLRAEPRFPNQTTQKETLPRPSHTKRSARHRPAPSRRRQPNS